MAKNFGLAGFILLSCLFCVGQAQTEGSYVIRGKVIENSGLPLSSGFVSVYRESEPGKRVAWAQTDREGHATIRLNEPGVYLLVPRKQAEGYVAGVLPFFKDPATPATRVILSEDAASVEATIVVPPKNGALVGTAVDATTNLPIEELRFQMCHADNHPICFSLSATDSRGRFRIDTPHVPFILKISADGYHDWFGLSGSGAQERLFVASAKKTELHVRLNRTIDSTGKPMTDAEKAEALYLPAPIQLSPADNIEFEHFPRTTTVEWSPVEGAVSYTVEINYCQPGFKDRRQCLKPQPFAASWNPPLSAIKTTSYTFTFLGAQPGRWRVWAIDKDGREGFKSDWRKFVYTH